MIIVEDTVRLPDGETAEYLREAPTKAHSVAIIAIDDENNLLIQREYSYPTGRILYQLPGGAALESEDILVAAKRELSEESGFSAKSCTVAGWFYINNRRSDRKQYVVIAKDLTIQHSDGDKEEFIESEWMSFSELRTRIKSGDIQNVNLLAALCLYDQLSL